MISSVGNINIMSNGATGCSSGVELNIKRRTCDRCRRQKLRCPRSSLENEQDCARCERLGVKCEYGNPLPKGRPRSRRAKVHSDALNSHNQKRTLCSTSDLAEYNTPLGDEKRSLQDSDWEWIWELPTLDAFIEDPGIGGTLDSTHDPNDQAHLAEDHTDTQMIQSIPGHDARRPSKVYPPRADSTGRCIQQLSDLNARLYPVHKVCRAIDLRQHQYSGGLVTEAAFETVPALVESSDGAEPPLTGKCNVLYEILRGSRSLVNIVAQLLHREKPSGIAPKSLEPLEEPGESVDIESSEEPASSSDVVYYLILGCYTRILQLHGSLIRAFHHDASNAVDAQGDFELSSISSTELRLVMLVNLVARLIKRLRTIHSRYFSQIERSSITGGIESNIAKHRAGLEKISLLEQGLERKLDDLQLVLRC